MAVRALRGRRVLQVGVATLLPQLPLGLLLSPPLLLPQELLRLQEDSGVDAPAAAVAVPGALVAGVPGVVLGRLEAFAQRVGLVPGVLGDGAGVLPGLPGDAREGEKKIKLTCSQFKNHNIHQTPSWFIFTTTVHHLFIHKNG